MSPSRHARASARIRRGFTLVEIVITLTILGIVGAGLVKLILVQARFSESQMALRNARTVSRNAMNIMLTDLRMVQDKGGLIAASPESVTVRIPLAFGLVCTTGAPAISLLPVDSAMSAMAVYAGYAVRDSISGEYSYTPTASPTPVNNLTTITVTPNPCTMAGISPTTYGTRTSRIVSLSDVPSGTSNVGWPAFIYQVVTYKFAASTAFPGKNRRGLWRLVKSSNPAAPVTDEIIAPFDSATAKFRFYVLNADVAQDAVPANLNDVRGVELVLAGSSNQPLSAGAQAKQATMVTGVFFKNRRDP
jgi:prepilin-type N-terminal cleavage/methylation domain-containing protein